MKRDFKQSRPDKWSEKSRSQPERSEYNNEVLVNTVSTYLKSLSEKQLKHRKLS